MENKYLELYEVHKNPPDWALKKIEAGRLKGMSDINPQWRINCLTETYGLCGFGWKYEIVRVWNDKGENEISTFAQINLYIKLEDKWSEPIPAIGGSKFLTLEKNGLYQSDECIKMAITDALGVCCKYLGIAGNVYAGSKYSQAIEQINIKELNNLKTEEELKKANELNKKLKEFLKQNINSINNEKDLKEFWEQNKEIISTDKELINIIKVKKEQILNNNKNE